MMRMRILVFRFTINLIITPPPQKKNIHIYIFKTFRLIKNLFFVSSDILPRHKLHKRVQKIVQHVLLEIKYFTIRNKISRS